MDKKAERGLWVTVILLLLALVVIAIFASVLWRNFNLG